MKRHIISVLFLFLVFLPYPCAAGENVTLQLGWKHQFQFAGYYAALHKGYYRAAGLDVEIVEGGQGKFARESMLSGNADYGVAGSELVLHRRDGEPFVLLAPIFQHSPSILLVRKDSGIRTLQDLVGKRVMLLSGKKDADILAAFLNEGIPIDTFERLDHTYSPDALIAHHTDAVSSYITNEPYYLALNGVAPGIISPQTYGVDFYSDCLFTTETEVTKRPGRVDAFLDASLRGWEYAMANTGEIADLILSTYNAEKSRDHLLYEAEAIRKIMLPDLVQIGHMNPGRWRHIIQTYASMGMINPDFSLKGFLYGPPSKKDYAWLKRVVFAAILASALLATGALTLYRFNRKLAREARERRQSEIALKKSEERFDLAMQHTNDGLYDWDLITGQIYYSPGWKRMLGYQDHEIENTYAAWEELTDPKGARDAMALLDQVILGELDRFKQEFRMRHRDGHWVDVLSRANVIFDAGGKAVRVVGTHVDISQQKKTERALVRRKEEAERYLNLSGVMFVGLDKNGHVNLANKKACTILECDEKEILGRNWFSHFVPLSRREEVRKVFRQLMSGEIEPVKYHENQVVSKSGVQKIIAWYNSYLTDDDGEIIGILSSGEDISEKKQLEAHLFNARKMESIGNLAGGIAHEFNNILSIIIGNNELLMSDLPGTGLARESAEEIRTAGKRARDVVRQLLTFSRQDNAVRTALDIRQAVGDAVKLIRSSTPANIDIQSVLEPDMVPVFGNETQLNQLMINLCSNAADAMPDTSGCITIRLDNTTIDANRLETHPALKPGPYARLVVADNGIGIDQSIINNIFDPYFTTKGIGKGTGIGLAVVHGIVERHAGAISVDSTPGKGTTFTILFPAHDIPAGQATEPEEDLPTGTAAVLFVDDEPGIAKLGSRHLSDLGYSVVSFTSPREALDCFRAEPGRFDLVVSDVSMPGMTGDQLTTKILAIRPDMPVILCTGYSAKVSQKEADAIGVTTFIMKPLDKPELATAVWQALNPDTAPAPA
ncbi:MAG: ABC transporter substrate-binding protein [Desulfobacter sp.]